MTENVATSYNGPLLDQAITARVERPDRHRDDEHTPDGSRGIHERIAAYGEHDAERERGAPDDAADLQDLRDDEQEEE